MSNLLEHAIQAIITAHDISKGEQQNNAVRWLTELAEDPNSWNIWQQMLTHQNLNVKFFASNALGQKIRSQWNFLDTEVQNELRNFLTTTYFNSGKENAALQHQLAGAYASLAIQMLPSQWDNFWSDIESFVQQIAQEDETVHKNSIHSMSESSLESLNDPFCLSTILHFLCNIPIEFDKVIKNPQEIHSLVEIICNGINFMLKIIKLTLQMKEPSQQSDKTSHSIWNPSQRSGSAPVILASHGNYSHPVSSNSSTNFIKPNNSVQSSVNLKRLALQTLQTWIGSSRLSLSLDAIGSNKTNLLPLLFDAIKYPALTTEAGEVLLSILARDSTAKHSTQEFPSKTPDTLTSTSFISASSFTSAKLLIRNTLQNAKYEVIQSTIDQLLGLTETYRLHAENIIKCKESESQFNDSKLICRSIVQLFAGVGDSNSDMFATSISIPFVQEYLNVMLEMSADPNLDIAELCLPFWNSLEYSICTNSPAFIPYYERLMQIILEQCMIPQVLTFNLNDSFLEGSIVDTNSEQYYQVILYRETVFQTIRACYSVIGDNCIHYIQSYLNSTWDDSLNYFDVVRSWRIVELCFFAAASINLHVPASSPLILTMLKLACSLPWNLPCLGVNNSSTYFFTQIPLQLLCSVIKFVAAYRHWIIQQEDLAVDLFQHVTLLCLNFATLDSSLLESEFKISSQNAETSTDSTNLLEITGESMDELAKLAASSFEQICITSSSRLDFPLLVILDNYSQLCMLFSSNNRTSIITGIVRALQNVKDQSIRYHAIQVLLSPCHEQLKQTLIKLNSNYQNSTNIQLDTPTLNTICEELTSISAICSLSLTPIISAESASSSTPTLNTPTSASTLSSTTVSSATSPHELDLPIGHQINNHMEGSSKVQMCPLLIVLEESGFWDLLGELEQIFDLSFDMYSTEGSTLLESITSVYQSIIRSCEELVAPILSHMLERLLHLFQAKPNGIVIDTFGQLVKLFGQEAELLPIFSNILLISSKSVFALMTQEEQKMLSIENAKNNPECIYESNSNTVNSLITYNSEFDKLLSAYCSLCCDIVDQSPNILLQDEQAELPSSLFQLCVYQMSMSTEFTDTLKKSIELVDKLLFAPCAQQHDNWRTFVESMVQIHGGELISSLLHIAVITSHNKVHFILSNLFIKLTQLHKTAAEHFLPTVLTNINGFTDSLTQEECYRLVYIFVNIRSAHIFKQFIKDLADICNKKAKPNVLDRYESLLDNGISNGNAWTSNEIYPNF